MYLTKISINPSSRQANHDLDNPYEIHRTVMSAFPDGVQRESAAVLFRMETQQNRTGKGDPILLVQSKTLPDWHKLKQRRNYLLNCEEENPIVKPFYPKVDKAQILRFRLLANPTSRRSSDQKLIPITDKNALFAWISKKGSNAGFSIIAESLLIAGLETAQFEALKPNRKNQITLHKVLFEGYLQVTSPEKLIQAVQEGIGRGRSFGCGLLSLARV